MSLINDLIDALRCLPGVGPKSAQRMAFHILERDRLGGEKLAKTLADAVNNVTNCARCRTLTESEICRTCADSTREQSQLCVVENPMDTLAIEQATGYRGLYFVLMGRLSPLDGVGPKELQLDRLAKRLEAEPIEEMIIATNPTVEGEATAHYLSQMAQDFEIKPTRIAHGVPLGSELEYIDASTLAHAFAGRETIAG